MDTTTNITQPKNLYKVSVNNEIFAYCTSKKMIDILLKQSYNNDLSLVSYSKIRKLNFIDNKSEFTFKVKSLKFRCSIEIISTNTSLLSQKQLFQSYIDTLENQPKDNPFLIV